MSWVQILPCPLMRRGILGADDEDRLSLAALNGAVLTYEDGDGNTVRVAFEDGS